MKHSIRRQITVIFICVLVFILGTLFVVNMGFLERYYFSYKTKDLLESLGIKLFQNKNLN